MNAKHTLRRRCRRRHRCSSDRHCVGSVSHASVSRVYL